VQQSISSPESLGHRDVALSGEESAYRVRIGDHRIVYEIFDARLVIQVVRVGHRRDVYQAR